MTWNTPTNAPRHTWAGESRGKTSPPKTAKTRKPPHITPLGHHDPFVPAPPAFFVTVWERADQTASITALLSDTPPTPRNGGGGWQQVTLAKRSAVTVWQGRDQLLEMDVPIVLGSGLTGARGLNFTKLLRMWRPADATDEPPVLKMSAQGNAVPFTSLPWVLTDVQWGDAISDEKAHRTMQKLTLTLTEYRADEQLQARKVKAVKTKPKKKKKHKVKHGETLKKIAIQHNISDWRAIASIQVPPINDPRQLRVGQDLLIPG